MSDTCDDLAPCVMADWGFFDYMGMTFGLINTVYLEHCPPYCPLTAPYYPLTTPYYPVPLPYHPFATPLLSPYHPFLPPCYITVPRYPLQSPYYPLTIHLLPP